MIKKKTAHEDDLYVQHNEKKVILVTGMCMESFMTVVVREK